MQFEIKKNKTRQRMAGGSAGADLNKQPAKFKETLKVLYNVKTKHGGRIWTHKPLSFLGVLYF